MLNLNCDTIPQIKPISEVGAIMRSYLAMAFDEMYFIRADTGFRKGVCVCVGGGGGGGGSGQHCPIKIMKCCGIISLMMK